MKTAQQARRLAVLAGLTFILAAPADAGPPLLCQPFEPGSGAALLPWGDSRVGWNTPDAAYDRRNLVGDTLRLLSPDAPVLARMENLRRATLYAATDRDVAAELMAALMARTRAAYAPGTSRALALFDAGFLIESYSQANQVFKWNMLTAEARRAWAFDRDPIEEDGYALIREALELAGSNPAMEYAASLMTTGAAAAEHRRRAAAATAPGTVLARHLSR